MHLLPGAKGPFVTELETFGRGGKVIIPVAGAFAEMSPELELELIQTHMTQKPMLRVEVGARALPISMGGGQTH